jgi:hypothetical protein
MEKIRYSYIFHIKKYCIFNLCFWKSLLKVKNKSSTETWQCNEIKNSKFVRLLVNVFALLGTFVSSHSEISSRISIMASKLLEKSARALTRFIHLFSQSFFIFRTQIESTKTLRFAEDVKNAIISFMTPIEFRMLNPLDDDTEIVKFNA